MEQKELEELNRIGEELDRTEPRIASAKCEAGRVTLELRGSALEGATLSFDARKLPFLAHASDEQLAQVTTSPSDDALWFPALDEHIAIVGLVETVTGVRSLRSNLAKAGGTKSTAKSEAARANGAKGGRPRKNPVVG